MRYYILAGEASGDMHGARLVRSIKALDPGANIRAWGGPKMEKAGAEIIKDYSQLAFMGFKEVIKHLPEIRANLSFCKKDLVHFDPDGVVFIDYPGFNLRIAKFSYRKGFQNFYYISPQVWAWKENRVKKIRKYIDKMLVILPFEKAFYAKSDVDVEYVGHPLVDIIAEFQPDAQFRQKYGLDQQPIIAVVPGSRRQEIATMLPVMLSVKHDFPGHQFVVAAAPGIPEDFYRQFMHNKNIKLIPGQIYDLFSQAQAGLITSGTATLEAALFNLPQVVCYRGSNISFRIAKKLVKIRHISLVNLISDKTVVKELIQNDLNPQNLFSELNHLLDSEYRQRIRENYLQLKEKLDRNGASEKAAHLIVNEIKSQ